MKDFVISKYNEIIQKACERYAQIHDVSPEEIQFVYSIDEFGEMRYKLLVKFEVVEEVTFLNILGVKLDFKGYSLFVPQYISQILTQFAEQYNVPVAEMNVMSFWKVEVRNCLYHKDQYKQKIVLSEIIQ